MAKRFPEGQTLKSHAFRPVDDRTATCFFCGENEANPRHAEWWPWFCRHCDYEGRPVKAIRPRPATGKVTICPSCLEAEEL